MDIATILSINQTVHNMGAVLFGAGPFYVLLFLLKRRGAANSPPLDNHLVEGLFRTSLVIWLFAIALQALSGAAFGLISLVYEGALPEINTVALAALSVKVIGAIASFFISLYLLVYVSPGLVAGKAPPPPPSGEAGLLRLRKTRDALVWVLLFLAFMILTGAAFLRWNI